MSSYCFSITDWNLDKLHNFISSSNRSHIDPNTSFFFLESRNTLERYFGNDFSKLGLKDDWYLASVATKSLTVKRRSLLILAYEWSLLLHSSRVFIWVFGSFVPNFQKYLYLGVFYPFHKKNTAFESPSVQTQILLKSVLYNSIRLLLLIFVLKEKFYIKVYQKVSAR